MDSPVFCATVGVLVCAGTGISLQRKESVMNATTVVVYLVKSDY
jgi:hypothetical protein